MNLYRLDINLPDGTDYPVADMLGPCLFRARAKANERGKAAAGYSEAPVTLTRISGAGRCTVMGRFFPGGSFVRAGAIR